MRFSRRVVITWCFVASLIVAVSYAHRETGELEKKVDQLFSAYDKSDSPGCSLGIVRSGQFVYKRGYGEASLELGVPLTPESVFYMGSVSKQFTAASVVLAAEQGYLSLDDDIRKYVPEIPSYGKTITLREMLHHTSGLRDIFGLLQFAGRNAEDIHPTAEFLDLISRQKALNFTPGDEFLYSNTNYFLMSVVIRRATGKPLSEFADENIFQPLGMTHTRYYDDHTLVVGGRVPAYEPRDAGGFAVGWSTNFDKVGDGGLMSSVDDLLKWDRNFYDNKLGKGTLVSELQARGVLNNGKQISYALGLDIGTYRGLPIVGHGGALFGYRTAILRFPEQKFSVICLCNIASSDPDRLAQQIADIYLDSQFPPNHTASKASAHLDTAPYVGLYRDAELHSVYNISAADGELVLFGQHLKAVGPRRFAFSSGPELFFESHADGAMQVTMSSADTAPRILERFKPITASTDQLAQYVGDYTSEELHATYRFAVKDGHLTANVNWQPTSVLEPNVRDEFHDQSGVSFVFRRDAAGHVTGCDLFAGRVRNIFFARTAN
jgi:CubicO group peptidase (beta-lactamase class C family)